MPQFHKALKALRNKNTSEFNEVYSVTATSPASTAASTPTTSRASSPATLKKIPSQFELARLSLREGSPIPFNEQYAVSSPRRKTRRSNRKQRKMRRTRRNK